MPTTEHHSRGDRRLLLAAAVVFLIAAMVLYLLAVQRATERDDAQQDKAEAENRATTAEEYVARIDQDCNRGDQLAKALQSAGRCPTARRIADQEPLEGVDGRDGTDGVDGADGVDGRDGRDGRNGRDGTDGTAGADGTGGPPGPTGPAGPPGPAGADGRDATCAGDFVCQAELDAVLADYATRTWVLALIAGLTCSVDGPVGEALTCTVGSS